MTSDHSPSCAWVVTRLQPVRYICDCRARFAVAEPKTEAEDALLLSLLAMTRLVAVRERATDEGGIV